MASTATDLRSKQFPSTGTWVVDPSHSSLDFVAKHLMVTKVRGTFGKFSGTLVIGDSPETSSGEAVIQAASLTTGDEKRDGHLHSPDFLDVENHPEMTFKTTKIESNGAGDGLVSGDLTIKGITRTVTLKASFDGNAVDPWGGERAAFSAVGEINREDWGMTWNQALETGGVLVSKKVRLEIDVQVIRQ